MNVEITALGFANLEEILTPEINASVLQRDQWRCAACGFTVVAALAVHHAIPRSLGGADSDANLRTFCANCHRIVHSLSVGARLEGRDGKQVEEALTRVAFEVVSRYARVIRDHRRRTALAGHRWVRHGVVAGALTPLSDALKKIVVRNGFDRARANLLNKVVKRVLGSIPLSVQRECSFRLIQGGRYFSMNAGNHLVFRVPSHSDEGRRLEKDLFIIWPQSVPVSVLSKREWKWVSGVRFAAIPCFDLELSFQEALSLRSDEWDIFGKSCRDALTVRRTRRWVSNVQVPPVHEASGLT